MTKQINKTGYYILLLLTIYCSYWIFHNANWIIGDNIMFIIGTAVGNNNMMMYGFGRFFPLAFQEFNILNYIPEGSSPLAHYIISAISFYALVLVLTIFYAKLIADRLQRKYLQSWLVCFFVLLYFLNISFLSIFMDIIYPERMMLLWFALFMVTYWQGLKSEKVLWFVISAMISILNMFYKEPVFGSYLVFIAFMCIFNCHHLSKGQKLFNWIVIAGAVGYIFLYYFIVYRNTIKFYNEDRYYGSFLNFVSVIFEWNRLFYIFILLGIYRAWKLIISHDRSQLFCDGLLFSGLAYLSAYILLNLNAAYYFLPVYILCMPAVIVITVKLLNKNILWGLTTLGVCVACFCGYFIHVRGAVYFYQYKRQTDMVFINMIADKYKQGNEIIWYQLENKQPQNKFANISASDRFNKLEKFLSYALNGITPQITHISELKNKLKPNQFLLYPPENETETIPDFSVLGKEVKCSKSNNYFYFCELNKDK